MPSTIVLKRRIQSVTNTRQITRAMQLVSASKLRRASLKAESSKEYYNIATDLLNKLSAMNEAKDLDLIRQKQVKTKLYIIVTSNTGLAGAFNYNVIKILGQALHEDHSQKLSSKVITIGSKGAQFARKLKDVELIASYPPYGDNPTANDIRPLLKSIMDMYKSSDVQDVCIIYNSFISTLNQVPTKLGLLPLQIAPENVSNLSKISNFEPDVSSVVDQVAERLIEAQIYQAIADSNASEQAMRMVATKNATDNASDLIKDYTLELNTARQAAITQELAEISGGVEALSEN